MRTLRGMTWDHPRGYAPLIRSAETYAALHPDVRIEWSRRSLRDFGVQPVEVLARDFDLIVIDHPFCGRARTTGCLLDLDPLFAPGFLAGLAANSVGAAFRSYDFGGRWALPTDAAAQVASGRPDLLAALGHDMPETFADVLALGHAARKAGKSLALPICQSDAACIVATFAANLGFPISEAPGDMIEPVRFDAVLGHIADLLALSHPRSPEWNPINTYDAMSSGDDIVYVPLGFGYVNYAMASRERRIAYGNIALPGAVPHAGAILGGAGCAVSATCRDVDLAVDYLTWLHGADYQAGEYFDAGGQPGARSAWCDPSVNARAGGFFAGTLDTLDKSWLRPRFDGFIDAFEHMGELVHRWAAGEITRAAVIDGSNERYKRATERAAI